MLYVYFVYSMSFVVACIYVFQNKKKKNIHELKLKMSCYNCDQDRFIGVCCHNAHGIVRTVRPIPRPIDLGISLSVLHAPSSIVVTHLSKKRP